MNKTEIVKSINSPYKNFKELYELSEKEMDIDELNGFQLEKLIPKVIDDDNNGVYYYLIDEKLYLYNEGEVSEVVPIHILFEADGYLEMDDDELFEKYDCSFSGEADDLSCYIYFE